MAEDYKQIIKKIDPEMQKSIEFLEGEVSKMHTGRVSPSLLEDVQVELFGQTFPMQQLGSISITGSRQLTIQPWDASYLEQIEKAIRRGDTSAQPVVDQEVVRVDYPPLSEEYRKEVHSKVKDLAEQVRQTIRKWRQKAWDEVQEKEREGAITEDDKYRAKEELQELVDTYNGKVEEIVEKKENELQE